MVATATITLKDYDRKLGTLGINIPTIAGDGSNYGAVSAALTTLRAELVDITDGVLRQQNITISGLISTLDTNDAESNRGNKWVLTCRDVSQYLNPPTNTFENPSYQKIFTYEIPTADGTLRVNNSNRVYFGSGAPANVAAVEDFVVAFEAIALSPNGGSLEVMTIDFVNRSV